MFDRSSMPALISSALGLSCLVLIGFLGSILIAYNARVTGGALLLLPTPEAYTHQAETVSTRWLEVASH